MVFRRSIFLVISLLLLLSTSFFVSGQDGGRAQEAAEDSSHDDDDDDEEENYEEFKKIPDDYITHVLFKVCTACALNGHYRLQHFLNEAHVVYYGLEVHHIPDHPNQELIITKSNEAKGFHDSHTIDLTKEPYNDKDYDYDELLESYGIQKRSDREQFNVQQFKATKTSVLSEKVSIEDKRKHVADPNFKREFALLNAHSRQLRKELFELYEKQEKYLVSHKNNIDESLYSDIEAQIHHSEVEYNHVRDELAKLLADHKQELERRGGEEL